MLNRNDILGAADLKTADVEVPEWGGTVRVRMLTGMERDQLAASIVMSADGKADMTGYRARLVAFTVVDDDGNRVFMDDDVGALCGKSSAALDRVFAASSELNKLGAGSVEDARGNSSGDPSAV